MQIKATVLVDNNDGEGLTPEWGLSFFIEYNGRKILLDTGKSENFAENAEKLGIDLSVVEYGVLSHAHYDHADGMGAFFEHNSCADFYLRSGTEENCYSGDGEDRHYIGIKKGTLERYSDRIRYVSGCFELFTGAYLVPHIYDMRKAGARAKMYLYNDGEWHIDCFGHEQSLVLETENGLVVFNSCCHGGADVIIKEAAEALGGKVCALIGGLHLFRSEDKEVTEMAKALRETGVKRIVTGHCTGDRAMELLKNELKDTVEQMYTGKIVEF